jgi:PAS domain S-box-containing protein
MIMSANEALTAYYDYSEVARSVLIAIAASYAALDLAGRVTAARGRIRLAWLGGGATAMGIGIWAMHLKGMLAFHLPVPVEYHWPTVLAALLAAILASAVALYVVSRQKMGLVNALTGSVIMGAGIAGLHYLCMAAMRLPATTQFSPLLVTFSILFAIVFSLIALLMAFGLREETRWTVPRRLGSAILMGLAVSAMHYTGMAAASFIPASRPDLSNAVSISPLANNGIVMVTLIVLLAAMVTSSVDTRASAEVWRLNQELESRVAERTRQLEAVNQALRKEIAERVRADEALRQSEDRLRLVIDTIPQQIWSGPPDGSLDFFNAQWLSFKGFTQEEVQGQGWQRMLHPNDREWVIRAWRESVANGTPYEQEERHRGADGRYRWFLARGVPLRDSQGQIVRWYGTNTDIEDRKEAESRLRLVIDTLPSLVWSKLPDGSVDFLNQRFLEYTGLSLREGLGWGWMFNAFHPEDRAEEEWRAAFAAGEPFEKEARLRRADGAYRWFVVRAVPLRNELGRVVKWYGTTTDIEDRKRAEQELRQAEAHIRAILEYSPNWIFLKDTEGRYLLVNREIERVFGISQEQIKGKTDSEISPPEQAAEYRANDLKVLRAGLSMEFEEIAVLEDGPHTSIVHKFPLFDNHGNIYATGGVATDITERKKAEEARRYSEEQYRTVVETATDAVVSIDEDSKILFVNPATTKIFGYDTSELIGRPLMMLMPESLYSLHEAGFRRYLATGQRHLNWQGTELTGLRKNGQEFPVEVSLGEMTRNGHKVFTGFIRDISEKRRAEEALQEAQDKLAHVTRTQAMGELAAAIAHEVNQPLTAIVTNANFSLRQFKISNPNLDELRTAITEIVNDGTRASAVISRIRGLLLKGSSRRTEVEINETIQEVITLLRNELTRNRVNLRTELAANLPRVQGDPVQLQQVLINLILNAIEAMRLSAEQPRKLVIRSAKNSDGVLVQVQDSGPGIEPERAKRIFEPFFTTKTEGIGMGLAISRSIIESHGGQLSLLSAFQGALFQFILPIDSPINRNDAS